MVEFIDLGRKSYRETWDYQEKVLDRLRNDKINGKTISGQLIFVEHDPVYTIGKSGNPANMLLNAVQLQQKHVECIKVDRGGDITYHGPGQMVVYPIIDLDQLGIGVKEYVHRMEEVVIRTIAEYGIVGGRVDGATGVWLDGDNSKARKICAIGVKCSRSITMHGLALNVNTDLTYFNNINPCGFVDKGVTSIAQELNAEVDFQEVKGWMLHYFREIMKLEF